MGSKKKLSGIVLTGRLIKLINLQKRQIRRRIGESSLNLNIIGNDGENRGRKVKNPLYIMLNILLLPEAFDGIVALSTK